VRIGRDRTVTAIVPSYVSKVSRAKKHLVDLQGVVDAYGLTNPYMVSEERAGKGKAKVRRRLTFTADPANTDIPIIAADVIYNLRSSLDHLMGSLVPSNRRGSVMFPIFFQGVWEKAAPDEGKQRGKDRERWASCVKGLPAGAVEFLKKAQPPDGQDQEHANLLKTLNEWSNRDRHQKLPIVAPGLHGMMVRFKKPDGTHQSGIGVPRRDEAMFNDGTEIRSIPDDATDVEIRGVPVIAIAVAGAKRYLEIPEHLRLTARLIEEEIVPGLNPYIREV
jgi:hypothetical protein